MNKLRMKEIRMAFPKVFVTRFFQLMNNRQFTESQRELQRLRAKIPETQWNNGYYQALKGMLLARKTNGNNYTFLSNINKKNRKQLEQYKVEFVKYIHSRFQDDFDRGYFSAWSDYIRLLLKIVEELTNEEQDKQAPKEQMSITRYAETTQIIE